MCLYTGKEIIYKTEKQWADWEKLFANDILDKGLISKIYKYIIQLSIKTIKQSNLKKDRGPNKRFFQRTYADGQQTQEEMLNIANQQWNEIKTTWDINSHHSESVQFSSVQSLSHVWLFVTPWITAHQASLSITNSRSSLKLRSIESVMPSSHLMLCRPLFLLPPIPPNIRVFSNESAPHMR